MSRKLEVQTDKAASKIVPCTYPGCETDLKVNIFYAPAKGRCSEHRDKPTQAIRLAASLDGGTPDKPVEPNYALGDLRCPLCRSPLVIKGIHETMPWVTFACADSVCSCVVKVQPGWKALLMEKIPEAWQDFSIGFNADAMAKFHDEQEVKNAAKTA